MNKNINDSRFDAMIRAKYENHKMPPDDRMWDRINASMSGGNNFQWYRQIMFLKIAVVLLAFTWIGTVVYYEFWFTGQKQQNISSFTEDKPGKVESHAQENTTSERSENSPHTIFRADTERMNDLLSIDHKKDEYIVLQSDANIVNEEQYSGKSTQHQHIKKATNQLADLVTVDGATSPRIEKFKYSGFRDKSANPKNKVEKIHCKIPNPVILHTNISLRQNQLKMHPPYGTGTSIPDTYASSQPVAESLLSKNKHYFSKDRLSFTLYLSPAYSYRSVIDNPTFSIPAYGKAYFNNRDQGNITYAAGAIFSYKLFPKIRITPGFSYLNYSYNFKTQAGNIQYDQTYSWLYTSAGILNFKAFLADSALQSALLNSRIGFTYLSIPVSAEYDLTSSVFMKIGVDMSFLIGKNLQLQAVDYTGNFDFQMENIQHLRHYNLNMIVGLGLRQGLNKNMSIIVNPSLRISLTALNTQSPVKAYPYTLGLNAGLRYYF